MMTYERKMFSDSGLHGHHLYPVRDAVHHINLSQVEDTYPVPTEIRIEEPGFHVPVMGRVYSTEMFLPPVGSERSMFYPWVVAAEVYTDCGDDGHIDGESSSVHLRRLSTGEAEALSSDPPT